MNKNDFKKSLDDLWESIQEIDYSTEDGQEKIRAKMIEYVNMTSAHSESEVKVLYAGSVNGFGSSKIAENIAESSKYGQNLQYGVLDKTDVFKLLTSEDFQNIHAKAFGYNSYDEMDKNLQNVHKGSSSDGYRNSPEMQFAFHGTDGFWAVASKNFVEQNKGQILVLTQNPREQSVVMMTEIPAALKSGNYETINGIKVENLIGDERAKYNILDVSIKSTVLSNVGIQNMENGRVSVVNLDEFKRLATNHEALNEHMKYATPEQISDIEKYSVSVNGKDFTSETPKKVIEAQVGETCTGKITARGEYLTLQERANGTTIIHRTANLPDVTQESVGKKLQLVYGSDGKAETTKTFGENQADKQKVVEKQMGDDFVKN